MAFLLLWLLLPIPLIFGIIWVKDYFFAIRQVLFVTPAFFILVAYGILHLADICAQFCIMPRSRALGLLVLLVMLVSAVVIFRHIPDRRSDFKAVGHFLRENVTQGDVIIAPAIIPILAYYFPEIYAHAQNIEALPYLDEILGSGRRVYIVRSRFTSHADKRLIDDLCGRHLDSRATNFRRVQITEIPGSRSADRSPPLEALR